MSLFGDNWLDNGFNNDLGWPKEETEETKKFFDWLNDDSEKAEEDTPRIERDGGCIKLISNENTSIIIDKDKIILKGNIIIDGNLDVKTGTSGLGLGTSIITMKNGIISGIK